MRRLSEHAACTACTSHSNITSPQLRLCDCQFLVLLPVQVRNSTLGRSLIETWSPWHAVLLWDGACCVTCCAWVCLGALLDFSIFRLVILSWTLPALYLSWSLGEQRLESERGLLREDSTSLPSQNCWGKDMHANPIAFGKISKLFHIFSNTWRWQDLLWWVDKTW